MQFRGASSRSLLQTVHDEREDPFRGRPRQPFERVDTDAYHTINEVVRLCPRLLCKIRLKGRIDLRVGVVFHPGVWIATEQIGNPGDA